MILRCLLEIIHNPHLVCNATFTLTVIRFTGHARILPDIIFLVLNSSFTCLLDVWVLIPAPYHATSFWTLIQYVQPSCHTDNSPDALKGQFLTASTIIWTLDFGPLDSLTQSDYWDEAASWLPSLTRTYILFDSWWHAHVWVSFESWFINQHISC